MIVCHCKGKTDQDIRAAVVGGGQTCGEVGRRCGAGTDCAGCVPVIREILRTTRREGAPAVRARS